MAKSEDECPFCGEPIEADAQSCPHCGSDAETGWKGDLDYWSTEVPEEDEEPAEPGPEERRAETAKLAGPALVISAWILFVAVGLGHFRPPGLVVVPALYLAAVIVLISRLAPRWSRRPGPPSRSERARKRL